MNVISECLAFCQDGVLKPADLAPHTSTFLDLWNHLYEKAFPLQGDPTRMEWRVEPAYRELREKAEWLLDLLHYFPGNEISTALRTCESLTDPVLKLWSTCSLLRRNEPLNPQEIESIAADHETRISLWTSLKKAGLGHLMPPRWETSILLATSDMVRWLRFPTELGVPPIEIECVRTFSMEINGVVLEAFLFRFRQSPKPWEPGEGWMACVAGPIGDVHSLSSPASHFDRWDIYTPEEHIRRLAC